MKGILLVITAVVLVGCAPYQTLEELELAALESGDWSAVEQRERQMKKRQERRGASCGAGKILVCENRGRDKLCFCSSDDDVRALLDSL